MQNNQPTQQIPSEVNKLANRTGIVPFVEKPSVTAVTANNGNNKGPGLNATELFSLFTADIIQEDVVFTR
jgi:hypothetical protein